MCIGRMKEGMVEEPVWKTNITVNERTFFVEVRRPRRSVKTGTSVYEARTEYEGEVIGTDREAYSMEDALALLTGRLETL